MTADPARFWLGLLAAFVLALWLLRHILLPFVLGMAVGYLLDPLVRDRGRRRMRAKDKGTGRRKSRKISERSWKFRAAADEGNARTLIAVTTAMSVLAFPSSAAARNFQDLSDIFRDFRRPVPLSFARMRRRPRSRTSGSRR